MDKPTFIYLSLTEIVEVFSKRKNRQFKVVGLVCIEDLVRACCLCSAVILMGLNAERGLAFNTLLSRPSSYKVEQKRKK